MKKTSSSSTRNQAPDASSRTNELREPMRQIRRDLLPYMTYTNGTGSDGGVTVENDNYYRVVIGKTRTITGTVWKDGGYYRATFALPTWARDAAPEKDGQRIMIVRGRTAKDSIPADDEGSEQSTLLEVRVKIQTKDEFLAFLRPFLKKLVDTTKGERTEGDKGKKKDEGFDLVGVHLTEEYKGFDDAVPVGFDFMGEGKGAYLAVRTSGNDSSQVVELIGPLPNMVESVDVRDGWSPILHVEANSRTHGLDKTIMHFRHRGFRVDESFGTLKIEATKKIKSYEDWAKAVDDLFKKNWFLDDRAGWDDDRSKRAWESGETPEEFVEWYADKYDLIQFEGKINESSKVAEGELAKNLRVAVDKVINCSDMNLDDLEDDTRKVIRKAERLSKADSTSARDLYMVLKDLMNTSEMNMDDLDPSTEEAFEYAKDALLTYKNNSRKP